MFNICSANASCANSLSFRLTGILLGGIILVAGLVALIAITLALIGGLIGSRLRAGRSQYA